MPEVESATTDKKMESPTKGSPTKKEIDVATQALNHFAQGKRHLLVNDIPSAVNSLQEACRLLAEQYGELAPECGDAYFYYGRALLELARLESGVLGNALDGVPEGEDMENSLVENPEKLTDDEKDMISEKVGEALEEACNAWIERIYGHSKPEDGVEEAEVNGKEEEASGEKEVKKESGNICEGMEVETKSEVAVKSKKTETGITTEEKKECQEKNVQGQGDEASELEAMDVEMDTEEKCVKEVEGVEKATEGREPEGRPKGEGTKAEPMDEVANEKSETEGDKEECKSKGAKEDSKAESAKEDSKAEGAREDSKAEGAKEDSKAEGAKEDSKAEGEGAKEESKTEGAKEESKTEGAKEESKTEGAKEESKAEGAKEESRAEGSKEESKAGGSREESKAGGSREESKAGGSREESKAGGSREESKAGGSREESKAGGSREESKAGGSREESKAGGSREESQAGGSREESKAGGSREESKAGGSREESKAGGSREESKAGGSREESKAGGSREESKAGGSREESKAGGAEGESKAGGAEGESKAGGAEGESKAEGAEEGSEAEGAREGSKEGSKAEGTKEESKAEGVKEESREGDKEEETKDESTKSKVDKKLASESIGKKATEDLENKAAEKAKNESVETEDMDIDERKPGEKIEGKDVEPEDKTRSGEKAAEGTCKGTVDCKDEKVEEEETIEKDLKMKKENSKAINGVAVTNGDSKKEGSTEGEEDDDEDEDNEDEDEEKDESQSQEEGSQEEGEKTDEDEDVSNLQLAWEMLELAKCIFQKQMDGNPDMALKVAQVHLKLGELSLENENYIQSVEDLTRCLDIQQKILEPDNRCLAESHYQLGVAHSFSDEFDKAIESFKSSVSVIEERKINLKKKIEEKACWTEEQRTKDAAEKPDPFYTEQGEIDELNQLVPDIKEKVVDMEEMKKDSKERIAKITKNIGLGKILGTPGSSGTSSGTSAVGFGSTSAFGTQSTEAKPIEAKPVSNIGHLIRKKRKPEDEAGDTSKKSRAEDGTARNGLGSTSDTKSNGVSIEKKESEESQPTSTSAAGEPNKEVEKKTEVA